MTRDGWLSAHAYLQPVAGFCAQVDRAMSGIDAASPALPNWDDYSADFQQGVPLLQSTGAPLDIEPVGRLIGSLVERLVSQPLAGQLAADAAALHADLRREGDDPRRVVDWLLGGDSFAPSSPGLLRYLGWTVMARYLSPVVQAFERWRDDDRWLRRYCPICGSAPAMAQLVGADPARRRLLCCGCCGSRWTYQRTVCPFCEGDAQRQSVVAIEGEARLRIDYCESCRGYLKTYNGEGNETLFLSDWSSLHLDMLAQDRGLKRLAASLYDFEPGVTADRADG